VGFFILYNIFIKKHFIMEDSRLQKLINKLIVSYFDEFGDDYIEHINNIKDITDNSFSEKDIFEGVFRYIIDNDENPLDYIDTSELGKWFYAEDIQQILGESGWIEKFLTKDRYANEKHFNDIEWMGETPYLICDDWYDFSEFFESDDRDFVRRILEPDWAEIYDWFDVDFENDVVDNLDEKSIEHIKNYIKENDFIGKELEYEPEGYDTDVLTEEMVDDTETILNLIDEDDIFYDLRNELESHYRWSYESAAEDELFNEIKDQITDIIGSEGNWDVTENKKQVLKFNVDKIFMYYIERYVECKGQLPEEYESYFLNVISEYLDCIQNQLRNRDMSYFYPDSSKVSENLNDYIISNL